MTTQAATPSQAAEDPQAFLEALVDGAARALPASAATALLVERTRSLGDRLAGRPGTITQLCLESGGETLLLQYTPPARFTAQEHRVSGGVVIARKSLSVGEWLTAFAGRIAAIAADAAGDAAQAATALKALGIPAVSGQLSVSEANLEADLSTLGARVEGLVSTDARASVDRISALLLETLPRVAPASEAAVTAERAATVYLPDTLGAYLALPADWARTHVFSDGSTPDAELVRQLDALETAVRTMRDAAVDRDAEALLTNGRFLDARFGASSLDLT